MQFETIIPAHCALPNLSHIFENFVTLNPFVVTHRDTGAVHISNPGAFSKTKKLKHEYHRNSHPAFKFHKPIVRNGSREITLKVFLDEKQIIVLEIMECAKVKTNQNGYNFTVR
jgi:hypothetical protein